jgi:hypothetical protein
MGQDQNSQQPQTPDNRTPPPGGQPPPPGGQPAGQQPPTEPPVTSGLTVNNWNMLCHLSAIVTGFIGPLVIWLLKKDELPSVERHGKEALNFNISFAIYMIVLSLPMTLFMFIFFPIAILMGVGLSIVWLILVIKASIDASEGRFFQYPLTIRFLK